MEENTFASLGRIEAIRQLFEGTPYKAFQEPCYFENAAGDFTTSASKVLLEGIDFDLVYFPLKHLGYKSVVLCTGELWAVMARPRTLSVVLGVSAKLDFAQVSEIWQGMIAAAKEFGYTGVSLELQPSRNGLVISINATGAASKAICDLRSVAHSKDLICVSGSLGAAYMGLQALEREKIRFDQGAKEQQGLDRYKMLVASYLKPELEHGGPAEFEEAGFCPSFGYFITRGLSDALLRLVRDSGLGAKVYAEKIPFEGNTFALGKEINVDPVSAAMNGGDDCRLLFTVPIDKVELLRKDFQTFDIIGHLALPDVGAVLVTPDGVELTVTAQGWQ